MDMMWGGLIRHYRKFLPVTGHTPIITLNEGNTPLVPAPNLAERIGLKISLYLKCEGANPTGSFKDRGMTLAISKAVEEGSKAVICASTGNTAASASAYAARAKVKCVVLLPHRSIALGKLAQSMTHGARVVAVKGNFDAALKMARSLADTHPVTLVNSLNPYRIEGQKTGAFEICDVLEGAPTYQAMPVGNAGNICAYWKGYGEYQAQGITQSRPRMLGFQAEGSAPIVRGKPLEDPKTLATAIRIGNPASWQGAVAARDESGGLIDCVSDEEILEAYHLLAAVEGVFVEPASAASVAGVAKLVKQGYFEAAPQGASLVCILTGHGLKDPDLAISQAAEPELIEPSLEALEEILGFGAVALA
jgi:threonine synthase